MNRGRRRQPVEHDEDEEDDEAPDSDPPKGYREAAARPLEKAPPEGEILEPTPRDLEALAGLRAQARNRIIGMFVGAALVIRFAAPLAESVFSGLGVLVSLAGIGLVGYAYWSRLMPRGLGPTIVRTEPEDEIAAGRSLSLTLLIHARNEIELDRVDVRIVARKKSGGGPDRDEVIAASAGVLAARQTIEADQAARLQTTLLVPEDAPPTSRKRGIYWRVEVSFGDPPVFTHKAPIRVLPLEKRLRERAERRKRAALS